jgi:serine/threonine-protein kinase
MTLRDEPRFEDRGVVARGGMSVVRRAYDRVLDREVAVKTIEPSIDPSLLASFTAEARVMGQLAHPSIVPVYDVQGDASGGETRLIMKLIAGRTLAAMLDELTTPIAGETLARLLRVFLKVCEAVEYAHARGVIHRDITPRNVMVGEFGEVYLMDWGLAVRRLPDGRVARLTGEPVLPSPGKRPTDVIGSGTPSYMAPEQAWSWLDRIDERTDVFGLGGVLYHMLVLRPPYVSSNPLTILNDARAGRVPPPAEIVPEVLLPPALCEIAMRALAADPAARYQTVRALREDLEAFERGGGWFATQRFPRGTMLMRQGEPGDVAYILTAGECEVFRLIDGVRQVLRVVGPGNVVGEIALVTKSPRTASVEATADVTALVVTRRALEQEFARAGWMRVFVDAAVQKFASLDQERTTPG